MVNRVISSDGTAIAFERVGAGPPLVMVDAAWALPGTSGTLRPPVELLSGHFTVYLYDRRGRGASGDTQPYAVEREVDDLAALIAEAGGSACCTRCPPAACSPCTPPRAASPSRSWRCSSPRSSPDETPTGETEFTAELRYGLVAARRRPGRGRAFFHRGIGVLDEVMAQMTPSVWAALEAVAPTLVYDCRLSDAMSLQLIRTVTAPTLVLDSQGSSGNLTGMSAAVVKALPNGVHRSLPGAWHGVLDETLAPVLIEFFG